MTDARSAQGTKFQIQTNSSPQTYIDVAEVQTISPIGGTRNEIDVSHLQSSAREYIGGLGEGGEFTIEGNRIFGDNGQDELIEAADDAGGVARNFKVIWDDAESPDLATSFAGIVKSFTESGGVDQAVKFTCAIRISGAITRS